MDQRKVILLTGASSGIGYETAKRLIEKGNLVYCAARRVERMDSLKKMGGIPRALDVADEQACRDLVSEIRSVEGRLDVLVNNAGYGLYGAVEETSIEEARRQFDVNIFGLATLVQAAIPLMRQQGRGRIVNVSSIGGKIYTPLGAWYHATKHALEGWSDCLRMEVASFGIDVVIVEPGLIATEFSNVASSRFPKAKVEVSAYKGIIKPYMAMMENPRSQGTPAHRFAKTMEKAILSPRPKTRYVSGYLARPSLFMRRWLSDGGYDRMIRRMLLS
ncbi:MAG: oxidoreductase [Spirochaetales bacterium]|nr:oxidoreductase [Spirochaetales bacterium]